jgi:cell division initiation protein
MRITPLDIQQKQFPVKMRGYDMEEVASFLEILREEMEELLRENADLKECCARGNAQIEEYRSLEKLLQDSLLTTQQMVEDYKANAKKQADLIIQEAELKAEEILGDAQQKAIKIHEDITDLKGIRRHFKEEVRRLIESHLRMIEFDMEREGEADPPAVEAHSDPGPEEIHEEPVEE